ncbi:TetR family transcriptional regulator [Tumebacillus permanentifrigoris]|uniref:TetR family transcriptional regulator n=1 Tax=Tumebacillus permanentifrigoris TaxID=378543 RepID=A0A316DDX0_9BACL|nr:TetR family transcriptional regulator [Tumebacillus permanentifrigoris]PWK14990.1 TetR family transcriptional regulator [Tumebacillus permanentifrigoris]
MDQDNIKLRILLAAKELFAEQGFDRTTVRQICEKAGANISLISYYFGGKEKVFQSIFETFFSETKLSQLDEEFQDPVKGIQFIVDKIISFNFEDTQLSYIINQELLMESSRGDIVLSYVQPVWLKMEEILQRGKDQGVFHFESLDHTSLIIKGICLSYKNYHKLQSVKTEESEQEFEKIKQSSMQFILNGLKVTTV